jgi:hypothetical protein
MHLPRSPSLHLRLCHDRKHQDLRREYSLRHLRQGAVRHHPALECFELRRFNAAGEISASPEPGEWFCPEHAPPKQRIARTIRGTPLEAVEDFARLLADEDARLMETLKDDDEAAFDAYGRAIERGLGQLREVVARREKSPASDTPKPRRSRQKAITMRERNQPGQTSLIEEEPTPVRNTS